MYIFTVSVATKLIFVAFEVISHDLIYNSRHAGLKVHKTKKASTI